MSIVAPNGQVRLLANVPLDSNYENTLYFESELAQRTYFLGLTPIHTMSNATRIRDGVIAVDAGEDSILNCNYLMFQNQNFSTKWFYAFITGRQYVNNGTTYISYQIDDIQTYLISGNVTLLQCLIERQHSTTDVIGDNIVGENMGSSELVTSTVLDTEDLCTYSILGTSYPKIIALNVSSFNNPPEGDPEHQSDFEEGWVSAPIGQTDGIANGSLTYAFSYDDNTSMQRSLTNMIEALTKNQQSDSIIGGYVLPARMFSPFNASCHISYNAVSALGYDINFSDNGDADPENYSFSTGNAFTSLDTYVPKNKKMFTAPFNWVYLTSSDGQNMVLQPQFMSDRNTVTLKNYHCITGVPEARFVLQGYKGQQECPEYFINYSDFPQLSYAIDGYKAWLASGGERRLDLSVSQTTRSQELMQNQITQEKWINTGKNVFDMGTTALGMMEGGGLVSKASQAKMAGNAIGNEISNQVSAYYNMERSKQAIQFANEDADLARAIAKTLPSVNHGSASNTSLLGANNIYIRAEQRCVNRNIAKTIDDYFTMYGYAQNIVATPNIHARPKFTYVKTIGCKVNGGAPDESITRIQNIFDNGIRFWVNASEVGNYSVNNTPA